MLQPNDKSASRQTRSPSADGLARLAELLLEWRIANESPAKLALPFSQANEAVGADPSQQDKRIEEPMGGEG